MKYVIKNILWATDFSREAADALAYAELFAKKCRARIAAVHIVPEMGPALLEARPAYMEEVYQQVEANKAKAGKKLAELAAKRGIPFDKALIESGSPVKKIIEIAGREKADLIVMGKRGQSAMEKILVGSVANGVLRHAPAPVLFAGKKRLRPEIRKILVPTDFSKREDIERDFAWELASLFGADLTLLHVLALYNYRVGSESAAAMLEDLLAQLKKREVRERKNFKVSEEVIRDFNAAAGIVNYAQSKKFDLIAISTYTHSKLGRFFLGSNTERVISLSDVPVFAIPGACTEA
jgi:nucleotide-binding universal stress UspA family protein